MEPLYKGVEMNCSAIDMLLRGFLIAGLIAYAVESQAKEFGPYDAEYIKNYDTDTITFKIERWFDDYSIRNTRLYAVDAPERGWRAQCDYEKELAEIGSIYVSERLSRGEIKIQAMGKGKFGRLLVKVEIDGEDLATDLIDLGYVRAYDGGKRESWCLNDGRADNGR